MKPQRILLSKVQAAEALSLSLRTIDKLIANKQLAVARIGKRVLIRRKALEQFAQRVSYAGRRTELPSKPPFLVK